MLTVHHLENSRSQRVLWLLEELGVPYELKEYKRNRRTMLAPPELKAVHPLGKSPVVTDDGKTLAESAAILEYLVDRYGNGRLRPAPDTDAFLRYRYWLHFAEGSAMTPLLLKLVFETIKSKAPFLVKPIASGIANKVLSMMVDPNLKSHSELIESELAKSTWFAGEELTAADIQMSYPLQAIAMRVAGAAPPRIAAFIERMKKREPYQRAVARGGELKPMKSD